MALPKRQLTNWSLDDCLTGPFLLGWASEGLITLSLFSQSQGMDATMIEPEQLAQAMVDRLKEDDLREYVFEDLTEIYTDLKHDNQSEYQDVIDQLYPQDV
jgi:hypothetical protein